MSVHFIYDDVMFNRLSKCMTIINFDIFRHFQYLLFQFIRFLFWKRNAEIFNETDVLSTLALISDELKTVFYSIKIKKIYAWDYRVKVQNFALACSQLVPKSSSWSAIAYTLYLIHINVHQWRYFSSQLKAFHCFYDFNVEFNTGHSSSSVVHADRHKTQPTLRDSLWHVHLHHVSCVSSILYSMFMKICVIQAAESVLFQPVYLPTPRIMYVCRQAQQYRNLIII